MRGTFGRGPGDPSTQRILGIAALKRLSIVALLTLGGSAALAAPAAHAQGATLYVAPGGTDSGTCGGSATTACATISQAVTNAASGDTISVAAGSYSDQITILAAKSPLTIVGGNPFVSAETVIHLKTLPVGTTGSVLRVGVGATVRVQGITFTGGTGTTIGPDVYGGDVFNEGNLTLVDTTTENGSAIAVAGGAGFGGGIYSGTVGVGLGVKPAVPAHAQLLVQWSFVGASGGPGGGNTAGGGGFATGGGIYNDFNSTMSVVCSLVAGNSANSTGVGLNEAEGGGIANVSTDTTTVIQPYTTAYTTTGNTIFNTEVTGNTVSGAGDAIGGGIENIGIGTLTLNDDTVDNNTATGGPALGGGVDAEGVSIAINNSTIALNTATASAGNVARGGGIFVNDTAVLHNVTIADNTATAPSGPATGGGIGGAGSATLANTLLARNSTVNAGAKAAADCDTTVGTDAGGNIADDGTCGFGVGSVNSSTTIGLGPLTDNGGGIPTMALAYPSSSAIGLGLAAVCEALVGPDGLTLDTDERGLPRHAVTRGNCDSGAYDTGDSITLPNTVTAALVLAGGGRLGFAASTSPSWNIGYITLQLGGSTLTVRQPVVVSCPNQCLGTSAVPLPGPVTETLTGVSSSARGMFHQGQKVVLTLTIYRPLVATPFGPSLGNITVSAVSVSVDGTTVLTANAPFLNARTVTYAVLNQIIP